MKHAATRIIASSVVIASPFGFIHTALANCTSPGGSSASVSCDSTSPNPYVMQIGAGSSETTITTVDVQNGATINVGATQNAISLGDDALITLHGGALVTNSPSGGSGTGGGYNLGYNTVEFRNNGSLVVNADAQLTQTGSAAAKAVNAVGYGNTITNYGTISSQGAPAVWFQDQVTQPGSVNTVDNYGTIQTGANGGNASAIGNAGNGDVAVFNHGGAVVTGDIAFAGGNNEVTLYTGSSVTGSIDGGSGNSSLTLAGDDSGVQQGALLNFSTLTKVDSGTWTLAGDIRNTSVNPGAQLGLYVQAGTLVLASDNTAFNGSVTVYGDATLQLGNGGAAGGINSDIANDGTVAFDRTGTYVFGGSISGAGGVNQLGSGTVILDADNPYTGNTQVSAGTLAIGDSSHTSAALSGGGATTVAAGATMKLLRAARAHSGESKRLRYQRSDQPGIG